MACPCFYPTERLDDGRREPMPLGDAYAGECRAGSEPYRPSAGELRAWCNLGYARGGCGRFPEQHGCDAVRFAVRRDEGARLIILCALERDHRPQGRHEFEFDGAADALLHPPNDANLHQQALAYARAYLRRRAPRPAAAPRAAVASGGRS